METRSASCSCGQLTATTVGEPVRVSICHCLACQRRTGGVYAAQARFPRSEVTTHGESTAFERVGDSGGRARFHFCPRCGSTVYYTIDALPDVIAIPVGAFADPSFPPPQISVYEARKHGWVSVPDAIEHLP